MRFIALFLLIFLIVGLLGMLVFLNMQPVKLILTPVINGIYYHLPVMPLGLLVVCSLAVGFLLGYILSFMQRLR